MFSFNKTRFVLHLIVVTFGVSEVAYVDTESIEIY